MKIIIKDINYPLSLYYSYLLPLFRVEKHNNGVVFTKEIGNCRGLRCKYMVGNETTCIIPNNCSHHTIRQILGIENHKYVKEFFNKLGIFKNNVFAGLTLMHSPRDKLYIFTSIFLSRNTDYYANTVKWIKIIHRNNCLTNPLKCAKFIRSYQYKQLIEIYDDIVKFLSKNNYQPLEEAVELLKIKYVGLKTINAYLLHTYGITEYAPIDRHYQALLRSLGVKPYVPNKKYCLCHEFNCSKCLFKNTCIYGLTRNIFKHFNGFIQSISYIQGRIQKHLTRKIKHRSKLEETIIDLIRHEGFNTIIKSYIELIDSIKILFNFERSQL